MKLKCKKRYIVIALCVIAVCGLLYDPKAKLEGEMIDLDLTKTSNEFYLEEEDYNSQMIEIVQPYLEQYCVDGYLDTQDGAQLYYKTYQLENSNASIVISHGFTESINKYEEVIYYFLRSGYSVYAMDHRGHGYSTRTVDDLSLVTIDDFDTYVNDFAYFMTEVVEPSKGEQEYYLYAHSMGGGIGARVLEVYPDYFDKAVLTTPMLGINTGLPKNVAKLAANIMVALGFGEEYLIGYYPFDGVRDFESFSSSSLARFNYYFDQLLANEYYQTYGGSYQWLKQCMKGIDEVLDADNLEKITTPILMFQAELDSLVLPSGHYQFVNAVDSAELIYVEGTKHEIYSSPNEIMIPYFNTIFEFYAAE